MKNLFSFLTAILMASSTIAQTIEVCKTCPISSIKDAIIQAKDFDTIIVKKGTYKEHDILVNKPLTIIFIGFSLFGIMSLLVFVILKRKTKVITG